MMIYEEDAPLPPPSSEDAEDGDSGGGRAGDGGTGNNKEGAGDACKTSAF